MIFINRIARKARIFLDGKSRKFESFLNRQYLSWRRIESEYPIGNEDKKELIKYFFEMVDCVNGPGPYIQKYNFVCINKNGQIKQFKNRPLLSLGDGLWFEPSNSDAFNRVSESMLEFFMDRATIFSQCFPVYENIAWDKSLMWLKPYL